MEFYKIAAKYLRSCNIRFSKTFFRSRMQSHPDYPSLVSFTDTLDEIGLAYSAVIADKEKYKLLQYPLLAHVKMVGGEDFLLIGSATQFEKNNNSLLEDWNGIAIMIGYGLRISYKEHDNWLEQERKEQRSLLLSSILFICILLSTTLYHFTLTGLLIRLLCIVGVAICSLIVLHSMGKDNAITEQLCTANGNEGCNKVLHSKAATLWNGVGLGDVGLIYFVGTAIFLALSSIANIEGKAFTLLFIPFTFSVLLSVVSLWYQWKVAKSWCKMCLIVISIVWIEAAMLLTTDISNIYTLGSLMAYVLLPTSLLISAIVWLVIKPLILKADEAFKDSIAILKWKRDPEIFLSQLYRQRKVDVTPWEDDILLGNPKAIVHLIVACNPYCKPCANVHLKLEELLKLFPENLCLTIRFVLNSTEPKDKRVIAVTNIINAYHENLKQEKFIVENSAVADWYSNMDLSRFKVEYPTEPSQYKYKTLLSKHYLWSKESNIIHTPTIFINGYEMGNKYSINDMKLLLNQLIDIITPLTTVANVIK